MSGSSYFRSLWQKRVAQVVSAGICTCWILLGTDSIVHAQNPVTIIGIEEDWELVVGTPDPKSSGPQVTCSIAPHAADDSLYAAFELNHRTLPEFERGGMQLQVWSSAYNLDSNHYPQNEIMSTTGETVTWTMSMRLAGGNLTFEVKDGHSTTWGNFGGQGYLRSSQSCDFENLNSYSANDSIENSGVGFASNRVQSLTLQRVRYTLSNGVVVTVDEPRIVHQLQ